MAIKRSKASNSFDLFNHIFLLLVAILCILPIIYVVGASLASDQELLAAKIFLIPKKASLEAYRYVFTTNVVPRSMLVSIFITVIGTSINLILTVLTAYPLSKKYVKGGKTILMLIVFTMVFSGGMIPTYLVVTSLKLTNTFWSLWLPTAISAFNLILIKSFFQQIPQELEEAAELDGCSQWGILFKVVIPLSLPSLATIALFYAVGHWNSYFPAILYINDPNKWPIQVWLRQIVLLSSGGFSNSSATSEITAIPPQSMQYAVIVIATIPVLVLYPFLQKYFAKGALIGGVKG